jgi:protein-L-isoaspartate O-methyltransferase
MKGYLWSMNNMLETVARSLRELCKRNGRVCHGDDETGWRNYVSDAIYIIEQMRTPSMAMDEAVFEAGDEMLVPSGDRPEARMVWTEMIDAALLDKP